MCTEHTWVGLVIVHTAWGWIVCMNWWVWVQKTGLAFSLERLDCSVDNTNTNLPFTDVNHLNREAALCQPYLTRTLSSCK